MSARTEPIVAEELDVLARVAELPVDVDVEAMAVIANVWRAAQEARAQLRFEFQDLLRQRRLGNVLDLGGAGKRSVTGDCTEIT